jgi:hypothetical protein
VLRECDEVRGQLCRDSERSRSSFTKKYRCRLRIDLLRQSLCLAIIGSRLYLGLRSRVLRESRQKSH